MGWPHSDQGRLMGQHHRPPKIDGCALSIVFTLGLTVLAVCVTILLGWWG